MILLRFLTMTFWQTDRAVRGFSRALGWSLCKGIPSLRSHSRQTCLRTTIRKNSLLAKWRSAVSERADIPLMSPIFSSELPASVAPTSRDAPNRIFFLPKRLQERPKKREYFHSKFRFEYLKSNSVFDLSELAFAQYFLRIIERGCSIGKKEWSRAEFEGPQWK